MDNKLRILPEYRTSTPVKDVSGLDDAERARTSSAEARERRRSRGSGSGSRASGSSQGGMGKSRSMPELDRCGARACAGLQVVERRTITPHTPPHPFCSAEMAQLKEEMEAKDARIKAVEGELVRHAQESAREISDLKLRLFEMEMGSDDGSDGSVGGDLSEASSALGSPGGGSALSELSFLR